MNLPWDKSWFKLSFYAVFTFICIYIAKYAIDTIAYTLVNMAGIYSVVLSVTGKIFSVFSVIIGGFVISYVLSPVADTLQRKAKVKRVCAVVMTYGAVILVFVLLAAVCMLSIGTSGDDYIREITSQIEIYTDNINKFRNRAEALLGNTGILSKAMDNAVLSLKAIPEAISTNIPAHIRSAGNKTATLLLSGLVSFYFVKDNKEISRKLKEYANVLLPEGIYGYLCGLLRDIDDVLAGYVRGQLTDAVIMSSLLSLGLAVVKIPFALIIGVISGFLNIIPYFGSLLGFFLAVIMALISGEPIRAIYAAAVIIALQQIDAAFIVPKVVGHSVKLSPLMIIISLAVSGRLFGLWGLVIAVPTVAVLKLRFDRYCRKKDTHHGA